MNEKNLKPFTSEQSREKAKINGRKGGIKSGEVRRQKRQLKKDAIVLLKLPIASLKHYNELAKLGIDPEKIDNNMLVVVSLFNAAVDGDVSAFREIRDLVGEKDNSTQDNGLLREIIDSFNEL